MTYESTPLFRSGYEACVFAYAYSSQQYSLTAMAKMMRGGPMGSGRGLVGLDGAAVAGSVKRHISALPHPFPEVIAGRHELSWNASMANIQELTGQVIPALGTGVHNRRMVEELVMFYFKPKSFKTHSKHSKGY